MEESNIIQLIGCADDEGVVSWVPDCAANYWGVYLAPKTGNFEVVADFYVKELALDFVSWQVEKHGYTLDDKTIALNKSSEKL